MPEPETVNGGDVKCDECGASVTDFTSVVAANGGRWCIENCALYMKKMLNILALELGYSKR